MTIKILLLTCLFMILFLENIYNMEILLPILIVVIVAVFFYLIFKQVTNISAYLGDIKESMQTEISKLDTKLTNTISKINQTNADGLKKLLVMQTLNNQKINRSDKYSESIDEKKDNCLYMGSEDSCDLPIYVKSEHNCVNNKKNNAKCATGVKEVENIASARDEKISKHHIDMENIKKNEENDVNKRDDEAVNDKKNVEDDNIKANDDASKQNIVVQNN